MKYFKDLFWSKKNEVVFADFPTKGKFKEMFGTLVTLEIIDLMEQEFFSQTSCEDEKCHYINMEDAKKLFSERYGFR